MFSSRSRLRLRCLAGARLGLVIFISTPALAQPTKPAPTVSARTLQASDAASPVPPLEYRSAFANLPRGVEQGSGDWKAANKAVGQFQRGHIDLLNWEKARATPPKEQP